MWRRLSLLLSCRRVTTSGGHHFIFLPCTYTGLKCPWCRYCGPKVFTVKPSELVREHLNCPVTAKVLLSLQSRQSSHHVSFTKHFNRRHQQILSLDFAIFSPRHIFFLFLLPLPLLFPTLSCEAASFVASGRVLPPGYPGEPDSNQSPPLSCPRWPISPGPGRVGGSGGYIHRKVIHLRASMNHGRW